MGAATHGLRPAAEDRERVALLLIDVQNTFCLPEFELFVAGRSGRGALEDAARIAKLLYRHLDRVTQVVATLDTHAAAQIFHPLFWLDERGEHPAPAHGDPPRGRRGRALPREPGARALRSAPRAGFDVAAWGRHYARRLAEGGKYPLVVWPYHSMLGGIGHALVSAVEEAVFFHSIARQSPTRVEIKGRNPLTENYSALRPEVSEDEAGAPLAPANRELVDHLLCFDESWWRARRSSHCVAWTVDDLLRGDPGPRPAPSPQRSSCSTTAPRRSWSRASWTSPTRPKPPTPASPQPACAAPSPRSLLPRAPSCRDESAGRRR